MDQEVLPHTLQLFVLEAFWRFCPNRTGNSQSDENRPQDTLQNSNIKGTDRSAVQTTRNARKRRDEVTTFKRKKIQVLISQKEWPCGCVFPAFWGIYVNSLWALRSSLHRGRRFQLFVFGKTSMSVGGQELPHNIRWRVYVEKKKDSGIAWCSFEVLEDWSVD